MDDRATPPRESQSQRSPNQFELVAIAASAGGLYAIAEVLAGLPAHFPEAIVIVQHLSPNHPSLMANILGRYTSLTVKEAADGDVLHAGTVYIAPPDRHLLVTAQGTLSLSQNSRVHSLRPSADRLFESVASTYKTHAIAVVLTGAGSDGEAGVRQIKRMGGTVIAQDENTSEFFGMPGAAIQTGVVDFILPLTEIAPTLITLVSTKNNGANGSPCASDSRDRDKQQRQQQ